MSKINSKRSHREDGGFFCIYKKKNRGLGGPRLHTNIFGEDFVKDFFRLLLGGVIEK